SLAVVLVVFVPVRILRVNDHTAAAVDMAAVLLVVLSPHANRDVPLENVARMVVAASPVCDFRPFIFDDLDRRAVGESDSAELGLEGLRFGRGLAARLVWCKHGNLQWCHLGPVVGMAISNIKTAPVQKRSRFLNVR